MCIYLYLSFQHPPPPIRYRFPEGQAGQLQRCLLPSRHPPDHRRSRALPDTLGGGQAQEEGEGRGSEQGSGRESENDRA